MESYSKFGTPAPKRARSTAPPADRWLSSWCFFWAIALFSGAGLVLVVAGGASAQLLLSLALMSIPGVIGALKRPHMNAHLPVLSLWALCAILAVCLSGGLTGPFAVFCLAPLLAGLVLGTRWRDGAILAAVAALVVGAAGAFNLPPTPPSEPLRSWLTLAALILTAAAAGGALLVERRRALASQEALQTKLAAFRVLLRELPELALSVDRQGRAETVFGRAFDALPAEALQAGLIPAAVPKDRTKVQAALEEASERGAAQTTFAPNAAPEMQLELSLRRTGVDGLAALLRPADRVAPETPTLALSGPPAVSVDLNEQLAAAEAGRQEAERGREEAEAAAAGRGRFLANMSHELRTPLNAIMGFSDMMRARMFGELAPKYSEYADLIHESGGHLLALINDILDMSKLEAQRYTLAREQFDVRDALNAALRLVRLQADDAGVKLRAVLPRDALMIDADRRAIKQIALNLLSNALKFTPSGGFVILTAQTAGNDLEIIVADTGVGIAAEDLERLGRPYEQAGGAADQARGSGLGLSLVSAFAQLHGGRLTLESRLGEGTAATLRLPVLIAPDAATAVGSELAEPETPAPVAARAFAPVKP